MFECFLKKLIYNNLSTSDNIFLTHKTFFQCFTNIIFYKTMQALIKAADVFFQKPSKKDEMSTE